MFKKVMFTLLISSVLAFSGVAQPSDYWQGKPKQDRPPKEIERVPEKNKGEGDRGGKGDGKKKDKKPGGEGF